MEFEETEPDPSAECMLWASLGFTVIKELEAEMSARQSHPQTPISGKCWMIED